MFYRMHVNADVKHERDKNEKEGRKSKFLKLSGDVLKMSSAV